MAGTGSVCVGFAYTKPHIRLTDKSRNNWQPSRHQTKQQHQQQPRWYLGVEKSKCLMLRISFNKFTFYLVGVSSYGNLAHIFAQQFKRRIKSQVQCNSPRVFASVMRPRFLPGKSNVCVIRLASCNTDLRIHVEAVWWWVALFIL